MNLTDLFWARSGIFLAGLLLMMGLELWMPYRQPSVPKVKRWAINLGMTLFNTLVLGLIFQGLPLITALYTQAQGVGVLNLFQAPYWLKVLLALAVFDFLLYVWHLLNHKVPLLWRFHRVHHTDLNMDVSTATRFHLGELAISVVIKSAVVYLMGADVFMLILFETLLVLCAQFHHSSMTISPKLEALIWPLFVPPSMHRIHHSVKIKERDSNYATIFSLWDRMLGTMIRKVDQDRIIIGVGGHFNKDRLGLLKLLAMPFTKNVP